MSRKYREAAHQQLATKDAGKATSQVVASIPPEVQQVLNSLSDQKKSILLQAFRSSYSGPTPPAELLQAYEAIVPGSAGMMLGTYQKQTDHRINLEASELPRQGRMAERGQWFGFILALVWAGLTCFSIVAGMENAAIAIGVSGAIGMAAIFVTGKLKQ